jgi:hypothetical protein
MSAQNINIEKYDFDSFEIEQQPFTMIPNSVIQKTTHPEATFLWIYLQSMPSTWVPNKHQIIKHFGISERTYERRMSYLNSSGLIEYRQNRNEKGTFGGWRLIILNGTRFNPTAGSSRSAKIDGVDCNRSAKKPLNGETTATVFGGHINTTKEIKEIKDNKNTHKGARVKNDSLTLEEMKEDNPHDIPDELLLEWKKLRTKPITKRVLKSFNKELGLIAEEGIKPIDAVNKMLDKQWSTVELRFFEQDIQFLRNKNKCLTTQSTRHHVTYDDNDTSWRHLECL